MSVMSFLFVELVVLQLGIVQQVGKVTQHCHHLDRLALAGNLSSKLLIHSRLEPAFLNKLSSLGASLKGKLEPPAPFFPLI